MAIQLFSLFVFSELSFILQMSTASPCPLRSDTVHDYNSEKDRGQGRGDRERIRQYLQTPNPYANHSASLFVTASLGSTQTP